MLGYSLRCVACFLKHPAGQVPFRTTVWPKHSGSRGPEPDDAVGYLYHVTAVSHTVAVSTCSPAETERQPHSSQCLSYLYRRAPKLSVPPPPLCLFSFSSRRGRGVLKLLHLPAQSMIKDSQISSTVNGVEWLLLHM